MGRFLVVLVTVVGLAAVAVGSAAAIPVDADGYQTMSPYRCAPFGSGQPIFSSTAPIRIKYGWGALTTSQLDKFIGVQSGSVTVSSGASTVVDDMWGVGDASGWSAYSHRP